MSFSFESICSSYADTIAQSHWVPDFRERAGRNSQTRSHAPKASFLPTRMRLATPGVQYFASIAFILISYNGPQVEFRHLRAFVAVAEELHFTKAAQRLQISQPPLSRHIRELEQEAGVELFKRTRPHVVLTAAGHRLLRQAQSLVAASEDFLRAARALGDEGTGLVKLGTAPGLWETVNRVRARHEKRFPSVAIEAADLKAREQIEALLLRQIDVGFLRGPVDSARLSSEHMFDERLVVLLRADHRLAKRRALRLKDLNGDTLLLHERGRSPVSYDRAIGVYAAAKILPKIMTTSSLANEQATLLLVASGRGICLAPESLWRSYMPSDRTQGVAIVPLCEPGARIPVNMVWRANEESPAVLQFLQIVRDVTRSKLPREVAKKVPEQLRGKENIVTRRLRSGAATRPDRPLT